jgi:hypothetical protein
VNADLLNFGENSVGKTKRRVSIPATRLDVVLAYRWLRHTGANAAAR